MPDEMSPMLPFLPRAEILVPRDHRMADAMYERITNQIVEFEKDISPTEEIAVCLANFGRDVTISVDDIGYHNPELLIFYGLDPLGHRVKLMQHVSQLNVLLMAVPAPSSRPANRIGFKLAEKK